MQTIKIYTISIFTWCVTILFGAIVFNTLVFYPNIFHSIPNSLELTMQFLKVKGPHHFFPPFGGFVILLNLLSIILWWNNRDVRWLLLSIAVVLVVFEFIFSVTFFWEKNTIMFIEGKEKHTIDFLQSTANSFQKWHWVRFFTTGTASLLSVITLNISRNYAK